MVNTNSISENLVQRLNVKASKMQFVLLAFLALFFMPMGLWNFYRAITTGFALVPTVISLMMFLAFGSVAFLFGRGVKMLPKFFDRDGITRRDGQRFEWSQLKQIEHQYHSTRYSPNQKSIWRIEIQFQNGTVWLLPLKIVNFVEVYGFVTKLPCEHIEKNV